MDHIEFHREKIGRLRVEIAQIQELNKQYRLRDSNVEEAQNVHGQGKNDYKQSSRNLFNLLVLAARSRRSRR